MIYSVLRCITPFAALMKPYTPESLPLHTLDLVRLVPEIGAANLELGRYDALVSSMAERNFDLELLLTPLSNKEAEDSSRIEGIHSSADEVLEEEAGIVKQEATRQNTEEIRNYRKALLLAEEELKNGDLTLDLVCRLHRALMDSERGKDKSPGVFRDVQNWIGFAGCTMEEATFVPPAPEHLPVHLEAWRKYLESKDIDTIVQVAVMHGQFEILHPFRDGNGRVGRILIPLFLHKKKALSVPVLYLSPYIYANQQQYYAGLRGLSDPQGAKWDNWIVFFLRAVAKQAQVSRNKIIRTASLYEQMKKRILTATNSKHAMHLLDFLFARPIFNIGQFVEQAGIHRNTALYLLRKLQQQGVVINWQQGSGRRPDVYCFPRLQNIANEKNDYAYY